MAIRIFIGSSSQALPIAKALKRKLEPFKAHVWNEGTFGIAHTGIDSLCQETKRTDFAVMILTRDDLIVAKGSRKYLPRDNVIFELGLFMGAVGKVRAVMLVGDRRQPKLPSDLEGITQARYDEPPAHQKIGRVRNWDSRVKGAADKIRQMVNTEGAFVGDARQTIHHFVEGSPRFYQFFEKWYNQAGVLYIFCHDLNWLTGSKARPVVEALKRKRQKLTVCMREPSKGKVAKTLRESGARFHKIIESMRFDCRMSILFTPHDDIKLIIRHKEKAPSSNEIIVAETDIRRDPYLVGLAQDAVMNCYRARKRGSR